MSTGIGPPLLRVRITPVPGADAVSYHVVCDATEHIDTWFDTFARAWIADIPFLRLSSHFEAETVGTEVTFVDALAHPSARYRCNVTPTYVAGPGRTVTTEVLFHEVPYSSAPPTAPPVLLPPVQVTGLTADVELRSDAGPSATPVGGVVACSNAAGLPTVYGMAPARLKGFRIGITYTCISYQPGSPASSPVTFTPVNVDGLAATPTQPREASLYGAWSGVAAFQVGLPLGVTVPVEIGSEVACRNTASGHITSVRMYWSADDITDVDAPATLSLRVPASGNYACSVTALNALGPGTPVNLAPVALPGPPAPPSGLYLDRFEGGAAILRFRPGSVPPDLDVLGHLLTCNLTDTAVVLQDVRMVGDDLMEASAVDLSPGTHSCSLVQLSFPAIPGFPVPGSDGRDLYSLIEEFGPGMLASMTPATSIAVPDTP